MKKLILLTLYIYMVAITAGCSGGVAAIDEPLPTMPVPAGTTVTDKPVKSVTETSQNTPVKPPDSADWINPGIVNVGNFYAGARAEFPLQVHNGSDGQYTDLKNVVTDNGEIKAPIPLKCPLAYPDKYSEVKLTSDNQADKLKAVGYDGKTQSLIIDGFAPGQGRILHIDYIGLTTFSIYYIAPYRVDEGYAMAGKEQKDWVIIAEPSPVFLPQETKDILIALDMPKGTTAPGDKWEFRIGVSRANAGQVQVELVSRWLIDMR